jgi:hypothetical protein
VRFRYSVRVLPGLVVGGEGVNAGERHRADGTRTSVLRFASAERLSLIRSGHGYWRYVPTPSGIRFLTGYEYVPGWGRLGLLADVGFRPLMGWATAWSFDRLRLWLEYGITPRRALLHAIGEVVARLAAAAASVVVAGRAAIVIGLLLALIPPSARTPAARRCLRRPPDRAAATAPRSLINLEPV